MTEKPETIDQDNSVAKTPAAPAKKRRRSVLLVDDDSNLLRGLRRMLVDEDCELLTASSPAEARAILAVHHIDLVVSDNLMPGELGTEFVTDVRSQFPTMQLMILSGYMPKAAAHRMVEEVGVFRVLNKPCKSNEIAAAIREALAEADD